MRRLFPMLLPWLLAFATAAQPVYCPRPVGVVARADGPRVTFFDPLGGLVCGELDLADVGADPPVTALAGVAICPLADGRLVAAIGDLESRVHLVDPEGPSYLGTAELLIAPDDLGCCGDFLVVTPGEAPFPQDPVTVVHLADLESNILELQAVATANACLPGGGGVTTIDELGQLVRLDLELAVEGGVLDGAATATTLVAHPLADLSVSPAGDCGTVVLDDGMGGGRPAGFDPSMTPTGSLSSVAFPFAEIAFAGSCTAPALSFVRSATRLVAFERQPGCRLGAARYVLPGLPVAAVESNADNFACAAGRLYVTVDRDEQEGGGAVEIRRQSDGLLLTTVGLGGGGGESGEPAWVAVHFDPPPVAVPALGLPSLVLFALLTLSLGFRRLARRRHPAGAAPRNLR